MLKVENHAIIEPCPARTVCLTCPRQDAIETTCDGESRRKEEDQEGSVGRVHRHGRNHDAWDVEVEE